jgi:hypothetical protein
MTLMLHTSSGRNIFDFVESDNNPAPSQQQIPNAQANLIQQQTRDAIKAAAETSRANNKDNKKNPKKASCLLL